MDNDNILKLLPKIPSIIRAALSQKNRERITELVSKSGEMKEDIEMVLKELIDDAGSCSQLILEILQEPLQEAGIDLQIKSRDIKRAELETHLRAGIQRMM